MDVEQLVGASTAAAQAENYCFVWCLTKSEWASWVQAIGSICAIIFSFFLARYQLNSQKKTAIKFDEDNSRKIKVTRCIVLFDVYEKTGLALNRCIFAIIRNDESLRENFFQFEILESYLNSVTQHDCPDFEDVQYLSMIKTGFYIAVSDINRHLNENKAVHMMSPELNHMQELFKYIKLRRAEVLEKLSKYGEGNELDRFKEILKQNEALKATLGANRGQNEN